MTHLWHFIGRIFYKRHPHNFKHMCHIKLHAVHPPLIKLADNVERIIRKNIIPPNTSVIKQTGNTPAQEASYNCILSSTLCTTNKIPSISICHYMERIYQSTKDLDCIICAIIYLRRLFISGVAIDSYNVHVLIFALFVLASKFMHDEHFSNYVYAKIGGMSPKDIMRYEIEVMQAL